MHPIIDGCGALSRRGLFFRVSFSGAALIRGPLCPLHALYTSRSPPPDTSHVALSTDGRLALRALHQSLASRTRHGRGDALCIV